MSASATCWCEEPATTTIDTNPSPVIAATATRHSRDSGKRLSERAGLETIAAVAGMTNLIKTKTVGVSRHALWFLVCNRMGG
jgi:hypothetical protein